MGGVMRISKFGRALWVPLFLYAANVSNAGEPSDLKPAHVTVAGVQVAIDPETGKLRAPNAAEAARLAEQFRQRYLERITDEPAIYHADGSISKQLDTRHRLYTMAVIDNDGKLNTACLPPQAVVTALSAASTDTTDRTSR